MKLSADFLSAALMVLSALPARGADQHVIEEPATDVRVRTVNARVNTSGKIFTSAGGGKTTELALEAAALFRFRERRLPPAGRDAEAYRALREFELATMQTQVGEQPTQVQLPEHLRLIVADGHREGLVSYCPSSPLTREALDLLELPGDSLGLAALLPLKPVAVGDEWKPGDWVIQMLGTIEAVESTRMTCKLASVSGEDARIEFEGAVKGQRFGANSDVAITGFLVYDLGQKLIRSGQASYVVKAQVGTVSPGLEATVDVSVDRTLAATPGRLTDALAESIPLEPPAAALALSLAAPPWGVSMRLDRGWIIYQAQFEQPPPLVILRLIDRGSLVAQCNVSPVPNAEAGKETPIERFESDIQRALGDRFKGVLSRERIPTAGGGRILRVDTEGAFTVKGDKGEVSIAMNWIYYLVSDAGGKQISFVFAVEPSLRERLQNRDLDIVKSLTFASAASKAPN